MRDTYPQYAIHAANAEVTRHLATATRLCEGVERGMDLIIRMRSQYEKDANISSEVLDYIGSYECICGELGLVPIEIDPSTEGVFATVKNICTAIWNMIVKIWDKIKDCFKWIFNAQYRASRESIKCSQQIAQLKANKDAAEKFMNYEVDAMLEPEQLGKYIDATNKLIDMLSKIGEVESLEELNSMITRNAGSCGIQFVNNEFRDVYGEPPYKRGTYKSIGWKNVGEIFEMSKRNVETMRKTVVLKQLEKDLHNDVESLRRDQNNKVADGKDVTELSEKLNLKLKQYKLVLAGQSALMERVEVLTEEFNAIAEDAYDVEHGTYEDHDDD